MKEPTEWHSAFIRVQDGKLVHLVENDTGLATIEIKRDARGRLSLAVTSAFPIEIEDADGTCED